MRGVYYSACSLCYKTMAQFQQKCLLMRDCLLFRRLLLPESTVVFGLFGQSSTLDFCPRSEGTKELTVPIYVLCLKTVQSFIEYILQAVNETS